MVAVLKNEIQIRKCRIGEIKPSSNLKSKAKYYRILERILEVKNEMERTIHNVISESTKSRSVFEVTYS